MFIYLRQLPTKLFLNQTKISDKMQPSIKMFFKKKESNQKEAGDVIKDLPEPKEKVVELIDKDEEKDEEEEEENVKVTKSLKRNILESDDEEEEENDKATVKRQAIASPISTPIKIESQDKKPNTITSPIVAPVKKLLEYKDENLSASPLMDPRAVIRRKISSGAHALHENIGLSWFRALQPEFDKSYFKNLSKFLNEERQSKKIYPPEDKVYSWTHHHDIKDTRVIILGQDPYFKMGQAHGLSFSVQKGVQVPPSLVNIYKELERDIEGFKPPMNGKYTSGDLTGWAKQGVLMLNTCLTVIEGKANSHQNQGWETFTNAVISWISKNVNHKVVFMLWGRPAQRKSNMIDKKHKILTSSHPSPLSAHNGFLGCSHFSKTNAFLREQNLPEIDWAAL